MSKDQLSLQTNLSGIFNHHKNDSIFNTFKLDSVDICHIQHISMLMYNYACKKTG